MLSYDRSENILLGKSVLACQWSRICSRVFNVVFRGRSVAALKVALISDLTPSALQEEDLVLS